MILANETELPTRGDEGRRFLGKAAYNGNKPLVELLIEKSVDITTKNDNGGILLSSVMAGDLRKLAAIGILTGMNINERNRYATNPLHTAASQENEDIVELLISEGTDLNIQNPKTWEIP